MRLADAQPQPLDAIAQAGKEIEQILVENPNLKVINLTIGVGGEPETADDYVPEWYREASQRTTTNKEGAVNKYYFGGYPLFFEKTLNLIFGKEFPLDKIAKIPASGGSHAISVTANLLQKHNTSGGKPQIIGKGTPTWAAHKGLIETAGCEMQTFSHLDKDVEWNGEALYAYLHTLNPGDAVMMDAVCQNPTGIDVPREEWGNLAKIFIEKDLVLIIDAAYLGFGKGIEEDSEMTRFFAKEGIKTIIDFSGSKLYHGYGKDRIGAIFAVNFGNEPAIAQAGNKIIRNTISNVPVRGQEIAAIIESAPELRAIHRKWLAEVRDEQIAGTRHAIVTALGPKFANLLKTRGLFLQTPHKTPEQIASALFPELGEAMGWKKCENGLLLPKNNDNLRIATIPTPKGIRKNVTKVPREKVMEVSERIGEVVKVD